MMMVMMTMMMMFISTEKGKLKYFGTLTGPI